MNQRDLFVIVADLDAENTVKTLLTKRTEALNIQLDFDPDQDCLRHTGRDSGCCKDAVRLLRTPLITHRHAMIIFDHHGCGRDTESIHEIESDIEKQLSCNGWQPDQAAVIILEPELESWVWANSVHVSNALGWQNNLQAMRQFLQNKHLWQPGAGKPEDPKSAMKLAAKHTSTNCSARLFSQLAKSVSFQQCTDSSFEKFESCLKRWFG